MEKVVVRMDEEQAEELWDMLTSLDLAKLDLGVKQAAALRGFKGLLHAGLEKRHEDELGDQHEQA